MWEEPIFHNPFIKLGSTYSRTLGSCFVRAGIVTLGHLRRTDGLEWKTPQQLSEESGGKSLRLSLRLREQVLSLLSPSALDSLSQMRGKEGPEGWQEGENMLSFAFPSLGCFEGVKGQGLYAVLVKIRNFAVLKDIREHQWQHYLDKRRMAEFRWRVLYKPLYPGNKCVLV